MPVQCLRTMVVGAGAAPGKDGGSADGVPGKNGGSGCSAGTEATSCLSLFPKTQQHMSKSEVKGKRGVGVADKVQVQQGSFTVFDHLLPVEASERGSAGDTEWESVTSTVTAYVRAFEAQALGINESCNGPVYNYVYKKFCGRSDARKLTADWRRRSPTMPSSGS